MDAFFTISSPVPVDEPAVEEILVSADSTSSSEHSGCVIA
nr:pheromone precursor [Ganoderma boninense]